MSTNVSSSQNSLNSQLIYQDQIPLGFTSQRPIGDPGPKTRELAGFIDDKMLPSSSCPGATNCYFAPDRQHRRGPDVYRRDRDWNANGNETSGDDDSVDDDGDDEDDEEELDDDEEAGGTLGVSVSDKHNGSNNEKTSNSNSDCNHGGGGSSGAVMVLKDGGDGGRTANAGVTVANLDGEMLYSRYMETADGSSGRRKDGSSLANESGESLRAILSDPVTRALMDDAMILLCGHSFGNGGVQHALRMKSCYTCSRLVSEESISPNLALRAAVQAYRREEELQNFRSPKRRRDRFEERGSYGDANSMDPPRGRGVQFPFSVTDRVVIKGNKRTPERFVGREAIVTTQCLNGWYVVKTLDNAESVKLQYRSLAKVTDGSSSKHLLSKMTPTWV